MNMPGNSQPTTDSIDAVKQNIASQQAVLVDVREQFEWDSGNLAGSHHLPLSVIGGGLSTEALKNLLPQDKILYTFCMKGVRSCMAADVLLTHGYDVRPLAPGYHDLVEAGF